MVVIDPRRTETAKVADGAPASSGPAPTRSCCSRCSARCSTRASTTVPAYVDGLDAVRDVPSRRSPRSGPPRSRGVAADDVRRLARELAAAESAAVYGRIGVSVQEFGLVCQWAVQLLNALTGNLDRPGGTMLTRPAVDAVGRRLDRQGPPRRVAQPGPRAARVRRRAARRDAGRRDPHPGRRPGAGAADRGRATRSLDARTASGSARRSPGSTSTRRSTSTSTRPPGTPT